jgi:hypothetical protein
LSSGFHQDIKGRKCSPVCQLVRRLQYRVMQSWMLLPHLSLPKNGHKSRCMVQGPQPWDQPLRENIKSDIQMKDFLLRASFIWPPNAAPNAVPAMAVLTIVSCKPIHTHGSELNIPKGHNMFIKGSETASTQHLWTQSDRNPSTA